MTSSFPFASTTSHSQLTELLTGFLPVQWQSTDLFSINWPIFPKWCKLLASTLSLTTPSCTGQHLPKEPPPSDLLHLDSDQLPLASPNPCVTRQWAIPIFLVSYPNSQTSVMAPFLIPPAEGLEFTQFLLTQRSSTPLSSPAFLLWALSVCKSLEGEW